VDGLIADPEFPQISIVFDATTAAAHMHNAARLSGTHVRLVDLTPAAIGPYVIPPVNIDAHLGARNVNMVTCGGQATIPMVAAVAAVAPVRYAEIVASIASRSAGPGTARTSMSSPRRPRRRSKPSAVPSMAKRSSSPTRPSRR